ncbi:Cyclic nucleotide-gated olfactory channel [Cyphomyrmex costatus]|uniref:Cyclic nucleotide-gated olfactory channel n=1 Tax=Cyphomyrmex costatus TaxID=456900 RepID=A0A151ICL8_9HYME|nr:Cyclic nucleotide-gated olfactory channel [Cyphomyrmex costatus]
MKLRTTVQLSSAMSKKPPLKREDSILKRFSTRPRPRSQETLNNTEGEDDTSNSSRKKKKKRSRKRSRRSRKSSRTVINPDENVYYYWLMVVSVCVLYNLWALIVRQSLPELNELVYITWLMLDYFSDVVFIMDVIVQFRTGYLEQGLMVYDGWKLVGHYLFSKFFFLDIFALTPLNVFGLDVSNNPISRFPRFLKIYRLYYFYYMVESRTVYPNFWRVLNLIHILLILAHWFGCFYYLLSEAEGFKGEWVYPYRPGKYSTLARKYLACLYWATLTLTTIGDLPTPETNAEWRVLQTCLSMKLKTVELHNFIMKREEHIAEFKQYCPLFNIDQYDEDNNIILGKWCIDMMPQNVQPLHRIEVNRAATDEQLN